MELRLLGLTRISNEQQPQQKLLRNQRRKSTNLSFSQVQFSQKEQSFEQNEFSELQACQNHFVLDNKKQAEEIRDRFQLLIRNRENLYPEKFKLKDHQEEQKVQKGPGLNHKPSGYLPAPTNSVFGSRTQSSADVEPVPNSEDFRTPEIGKNIEGFHRKNSASNSGLQGSIIYSHRMK